MSESRRERREAERGSKRRSISRGRPGAAAQESAGTEPAEQSGAEQSGPDAQVAARGAAAQSAPSGPAEKSGPAGRSAGPAAANAGQPPAGEGAATRPFGPEADGRDATRQPTATPESGGPETDGRDAGPSAAPTTATAQAAAVPGPPADTRPEAKPKPASKSKRRAAGAATKPSPGRPKKDHAAGRKVLGAVGSVAVLCLGAAAIAAGSLFPTEHPAQGATTEVTTLPAGDTLDTCPASVRLLKGSGSGTDPEFAQASEDAKSLVRAAALSDSAGRIPGAQMVKLDGSAGQELAPRLDAAEAATLTGAAKDGSSQRLGTVRGGISSGDPLSLRVQPLGGVQSRSAAARFYTAKDGDLAGLAAAPCTAPAAESWIAGASTTAGTTSVLHLVNSSASVTQVRIDLRGAEGQIPAPHLESIAIAPGEMKSLVLAAYAPNEKSLSLKVTASGGRVNASIQQSTLHGLIPGGVDYLVAGTPAANTQVIPGVLLLGPERAGDLARSSSTADAVPEIHVAATSAEGASVKIRALGPDGEVAIPGGGELVVASNATARLELTGLPAGHYTIVLEADSAVSAAVKLVRGSKANKPMDLAWAGSAKRIGSEHLMVLPEFGTAKLVLNAPVDSATVTVRPLAKSGQLGAERTIELSGSASTVLDPAELGDDVAAIMLSASGAPSYAAAVIEQGSAGIAVLPLGDAPVGREGVQVQLRH